MKSFAPASTSITRIYPTSITYVDFQLEVIEMKFGYLSIPLSRSHHHSSSLTSTSIVTLNIVPITTSITTPNRVLHFLLISQAGPRRHGSSIPGSGTSGLLWLFPLGFGGYYGYSSWTETIKDPWEKHKAISEGSVDPPRTAFMGEILLYKVLPLRSLSRLWGFVNEINLHPRLRSPLLGLYANAFGCNMEEAEEERLENYPNLGALFRRALKEGTRPVDENAMIVSPADGHVIWFGEVSPTGDLEQVRSCIVHDDIHLKMTIWILRIIYNINFE